MNTRLSSNTQWILAGLSLPLLLLLLVLLEFFLAGVDWQQRGTW